MAESVITNSLKNVKLYTDIGNTSVAELFENVLDKLTSGDIAITRATATMHEDLYDTTRSTPSVLIIIRASSNNAYYFAFESQKAAIGNLSYTSRTISSKHVIA